MVDDAHGADAPLEPDPRAAALLADAGFILAPELHLGVGVAARDLAERGGEAPFLKRSCAALSAFGWRGRVFYQDRSSAFTSRRMPPSR
jgi:hypothetical protein